MSAISGIDGGASLAQYFQSVSATANTSAATPTTATSPTTTTGSTSATDSSPSVEGGHHHHHHGHADAAKSEFFQQLQSAVTGALQSAQQNGTDANKAIEDAISQIFKNNSNATSQTSGQAAQPTATNDPNANGAPAQAGAPANGTQNSSLQAFFNTLQSYGVDPQQFHQDFLTAAANAQNGVTNTSTAFQSIPPGTLLDAVG